MHSGEDCQRILDNFVHYERTINNISGRVKGFIEDAQCSEGRKDLVHMWRSRTRQCKTVSLDAILKQGMILVCNLTLSRRDAMLKE